MMKTITTFLLFLAIHHNCLSQASNHCDSTYTFADEMPIYKNGVSNLVQDIRENFRFNRNCRPEGLRQIIWTIDKSGKVVDVEVFGLDGECKDEVVRQARLLSGWKPGKLKGKPICMKVTLPLHIRAE